MGPTTKLTAELQTRIVNMILGGLPRDRRRRVPSLHVLPVDAARTRTAPHEEATRALTVFAHTVSSAVDRASVG
jgi:hypothetical protein